MKMHSLFLAAFFFPLTSFAQVNSGSNGSDGALNPASNLVIDMADHPDGIYHYTSVNIPAGVTVSFIPNAGNKPVVWLVQGNCTIAGAVSVVGQGGGSGEIEGKRGGPGGFSGGRGPLAPGVAPQAGAGPGGGQVLATEPYRLGGNGSYGSVGCVAVQYASQHPAGEIYGNAYLLPLIGGSGGGGGQDGNNRRGGGGGGGAIIVATSGTLALSGSIDARGGSRNDFGGGGGSGGAVRLVATTLQGGGSINTSGGSAYYYWGGGTFQSPAGTGRIRIDAMNDAYAGATRIYPTNALC